MAVDIYISLQHSGIYFTYITVLFVLELFIPTKTPSRVDVYLGNI